LKPGRFLEMGDIEIFKSNRALQRSRDPSCHTQLEDFVGNRSQPAHGKRLDLAWRRPAKVKVEEKSRPFAYSDLANCGA